MTRSDRVPAEPRSFARLIRRVVGHAGAAAIALGSVSPILTAGWAAERDRIEMRIELFGIGGIHVATNRTTVEEAPDRYSIVTDAESRGIGSVFVSLASHSEVHGTITATAVRPQAYRGEVHRNGVNVNNRVDYGVDGRVTGESVPPDNRQSVVTPALMQGTVDQMTALFMMERQLARRGSCALVVAVFDGLRRYDLHFTDAAPDSISGNGERRFTGPTKACDMRREAIAGFLDDSGRSEGAYAGKLLYARLLPGDLMIPVQMEFSTEFGTVTGRLAEVRGRGVHLQFSE